MSISNQKWLQIYAKAIELQILNSKQQEQILENQDRTLVLLEKIESHFSNGFRSELKDHTTEQVKEIKDSLGETLVAIQEKAEEIDRRTWQQGWIWGGIALFTLANAVMMIINWLTTK